MSTKLKFAVSCLAAALIVSTIVPTASAGLLNGIGSAYNNGSGPAGGAWTGSTPFSTGTLVGYVDWAVFGPGQFPYSGYTPTPGELTYAFQVFETGSAPLSSFSLALTDIADNIGVFNDLAGSAPNTMTLTSMSSANWHFAGIPQNGNSEGLVFSSSRIPQNLAGTVVDTGQTTNVVPLPSPSSTPIPEPGLALFAAVAVGSKLIGRRRRIS